MKILFLAFMMVLSVTARAQYDVGDDRIRVQQSSMAIELTNPYRIIQFDNKSNVNLIAYPDGSAEVFEQLPTIDPREPLIEYDSQQYYFEFVDGKWIVESKWPEFGRSWLTMNINQSHLSGNEWIKPCKEDGSPQGNDGACVDPTLHDHSSHFYEKKENCESREGVECDTTPTFGRLSRNGDFFPMPGYVPVGKIVIEEIPIFINGTSTSSKSGFYTIQSTQSRDDIQAMVDSLLDTIRAYDRMVTDLKKQISDLESRHVMPERSHAVSTITQVDQKGHKK